MKKSMPEGTLAGLKIVEMWHLIAETFAAKALGDFGADVIKIGATVAGDASGRGTQSKALPEHADTHSRASDSQPLAA